MSLSLIATAISRTPALLIPTIERYLYGNQRTQLNRVDVAIDDVEEEVLFDFPLEGVRPGAYIEIDDELLYVWSATAKKATVQRGMLGTTAAIHAIGAVVRVEPRFLRAEMTDEIAKEIRSWPTNVYVRYSGDFSVGVFDNALDLTGLAGVAGANLLRVQRQSIMVNDVHWPRIDGARLERRQSTATFASGYALVLPMGLDTTVVRVTVSAPPVATALTTSTDLGTLGLTHDLVDIIPWGVAGRMLMTRDVPRTDANAQGRSRPAEEVRVGDTGSAAKSLMEVRDRLLAEAANRLLAEDGMGWA